MSERIAVIEGVRTPFCKAMGVLREAKADDLGAWCVRELIDRTPLEVTKYDDLVFGNVIPPLHAFNPARVISMKGGLPKEVPAVTVSRNCASGMEALVSSMQRILLGDSEVVVAGGVESLSHAPVEINDEMRLYLYGLMKSKSAMQTLKRLFAFRPRFLKLLTAQMDDPLCGLIMGQTAEVLAREFHVTRSDQDRYALKSQQRSALAVTQGKFASEMVPVPALHGKMQEIDDGVRGDQTLEQLERLRPAFQKGTGTITAGNSSQVTDGAVALLLMKEKRASKLGLRPLGYLTGYAYAGLDPKKMGLGPAYAIAKLLEKESEKLSDYDLFEVNEAFAAQVLAVVRALDSESFCQTELGLDRKVGEIPLDQLNVNGGAIALGHPLGASGARIVLTLLKELERRGGGRGIASLCVGGGQGEAISVEVNR